MKKIRKILLLLCLLPGLAGCGQTEGRATPVVTMVQITCRCDGQVLTRTYTQPDKMKRFLYYLRRQQVKGYALCDPERSLSDAFWIRLQLSDGSCRTYRQRGADFVSRDSHRWKAIDNTWGRRLYLLMWAIGEDPVANPAAS